MKQRNPTYRKRGPQQRHAQQAMTLTELLIVLAIVAVLAALLMPVLAQVRDYTHRTVCAANMRQLAQATTLYLSDNDEVFPSFWADPASAARSTDFAFLHDGYLRLRYAAPDQITWFSQISPFIKEGKDRWQTPSRCPADYRSGSVSYEYKYYLATGQRLAALEYPAALLMFWEQFGFHQKGTPPETDERAAMNVICLDGHSRYLRLTNTTNARFNRGPDLHVLFDGGTNGSGKGYIYRDIVN